VGGRRQLQMVANTDGSEMFITCCMEEFRQCQHSLALPASSELRPDDLKVADHQHRVPVIVTRVSAGALEDLPQRLTYAEVLIVPLTKANQADSQPMNGPKAAPTQAVPPVASGKAVAYLCHKDDRQRTSRTSLHSRRRTRL
jgi:hypothetical protein